MPEELARFLADYAALADEFSLPSLRPVRCRLHTCWLEGQDALFAQLHAFAPHAGWLTWQCASANEPAMQAWSKWDAGLLQRAQADKAILEGELVGLRDGMPCSVHLRLTGWDSWRLSYVQEVIEGQDDGPDSGEQFTALAESVRYIGKHGVKQLHYQLLWLADQDGAWRPRVSSLCGLEMNSVQEINDGN